MKSVAENRAKAMKKKCGFRIWIHQLPRFASFSGTVFLCGNTVFAMRSVAPHPPRKAAGLLSVAWLL
ncbi:MAG: hypothetical protein LUG50_12770 [Planctomycetaceae bacterium]|nr:hypothetical protein [Planctomycetaceae bacterium]